MKTIGIVSQKGGAGKTTLAVHLAVACVQAGRNTAIVDLDPQASATNWRDRRAAELPVVISAHASRLRHEMKRVEEGGGEVLLIDTAPHADAAALEAANRGGRVCLSSGVASLSEDKRAEILAKVRAFTEFNEDNDPHGEHDFGVVEIANHRVFWKIDYYDVEMLYGSETTRVLTIFFADEC